MNDTRRYEKQVRLIFWAAGLAAGVVLAYTTRFFLNGDALIYIEMGEALRQGRWQGLINLTYSPGYAVLLGIGQMLLATDPLVELTRLKVVNLACFIAAMAACDGFVTRLGRIPYEGAAPGDPGPSPGWRPALLYSAFLFLALSWVRVGVSAPDMLVMAFLLLAVTLVLGSGRTRPSLFAMPLLGGVLALGYLVKTIFFPLALLLLALAGMAAMDDRRSLGRFAIGVLVMLAGMAVLIVPLSRRTERFSYGETGSYHYAMLVRGAGEPRHPPETLHPAPLIRYYGAFPAVSHPKDFDPAHWRLGIAPRPDLPRTVRRIMANTGRMVGFSPELAAAVIAWLVLTLRDASRGGRRPWPRRTACLVALPAVIGAGLYALLYVEPRYLAPFAFLGLAALSTLPGSDGGAGRTRSGAGWATVALTVVFALMTVHTVVDQSLEGLVSTASRPSYRQRFEELLAVRAQMRRLGIPAGAETAIVEMESMPAPYHARLAGVRITAVAAGPEFLQVDERQRRAALAALRRRGIAAVVARHAALDALAPEGWERVPGTADVFILGLNAAERAAVRRALPAARLSSAVARPRCGRSTGWN